MLNRIGFVYDENLCLIELAQDTDGSFMLSKRGRLIATLDPTQAFNLGTLLTQHECPSPNSVD